MPKLTHKNIPRVVIEESPANDLYLMVDGLLTGGSHLALEVLEGIKEEGKEFERKAAGKDLTSAIASELFRDREKAERFLARVESLLKQEPRLLVTADVFSKYLRQIKAFAGAASSSAAEKSQADAPRRKTSSQSDDLVYYLLGFFSLVMTALTSSEMSQMPHPIMSGVENSAEVQPIDKKSSVKPRRATVLRSRSRLLR